MTTCLIYDTMYLDKMDGGDLLMAFNRIKHRDGKATILVDLIYSNLVIERRLAKCNYLYLNQSV